jgi:hypothetical protein
LLARRISIFAAKLHGMKLELPTVTFMGVAFMPNSIGVSYPVTRDNLALAGNVSGTSWGAILAGAAAAAALSLILTILGFGLGMSAVSPWASQGVSAGTLGYSTIGWLAFTQIAASAVGGYLAGRLRVKWINTHSDEVYFRDTAHGLLAWAVASLVTAAFLTSAISATISGGAHLGAAVAEPALSAAGSAAGANASMDTNRIDYYTDSLFRGDANATAADGNASVPHAEVAKILGTSLHNNQLSAEDKQYLGQLVAKRTGLDQQAAEARVSQRYDQLTKALNDAKTTAKADADAARKAAAYAALWMFIALLAGAFCAAFAATFGGQQRDRLSQQDAYNAV